MAGDVRAEWHVAFAAAQAAMPPIGKDKKATIETRGGGSYSYSYADLASILEAVTPVLSKHGLSVAQSVATVDGQVAVETRVYHSSGHVEVFGPLSLPGGQDARSVGSAVTYARRYALCAALGIAPDEDDDGAAARPVPDRTTKVPTGAAVTGSASREAPTGEPTGEQDDLAAFIASQVAAFDRWTVEERRRQWAEAMGKAGLGRVSTREEAERVLVEMAKAYVLHTSQTLPEPF